MSSAQMRFSCAVTKGTKPHGSCPCFAAKAMTVMPFGARVHKLLDPEFPNGNRYYTKEAHINELPEEALEILVSRWGEMKMSGEIEMDLDFRVAMIGSGRGLREGRLARRASCVRLSLR